MWTSSVDLTKEEDDNDTALEKSVWTEVKIVISVCGLPIDRFLTPLVKKYPSQVENSRDFMNFVTDQQLNQEPKRSWNKTTRHTPWMYLSRFNNIISVLKLCLNATYPQFQQNVYQQIQGTAMGSPVSVTVANLVMEDIEERALEWFHTPILFLDEICWRYMSCHFFPNCFRNSINIWTVLNLQSSLLVKSKKIVNSSSCFTIKRRWLLYLNNGLQEAHTHGTLSSLQFTPSTVS